MSHYRFLFWLAVIAGVAAVLAGFAFRVPWEVQFLAGLWLAILFSADLLVRHLPEIIQEVQIGNGHRHNGSCSLGRQSVEQVAREKLRCSFVYLLTLLVFPNLFVLWLANREVVPITIAVEAATQFHPDQDVWKSAIKTGAAEQQFSHWKQSTSHRAPNSETHKRALWRCWPVLVVAFPVWIAICCGLAREYYMFLLKQFDRSARFRAERYFYRDMGRMEPLAGKDTRGIAKERKARSLV